MSAVEPIGAETSSTPIKAAVSTVAKDLPALGGLRGYAALAVLLFHLSTMGEGLQFEVFGFDLNRFFVYGFLGVWVFYALSACLLTHGLMYTKQSFGSYLLRRCARVFPAFWAQLLLLTLAIVLLGYRELPSGYHYWSQFLMNFGAWPWRTDQLVGAWWTLPIEFAFYLILPLVVWPLLKRGQLLSVMLGSLAITLAFRAYVVDNSQVVFVSGQLPGVLDVFVAGTIAAVVAPRLKAIASDWLIAFGLVALVGSSYLIHAFLEVFWSGHVSYLLVPTLTAYSLAGLMAGLMRDGGEQSLLRPAFDNRPARFLGDISYGIYLWHMPVIDGLYGTGWFRSPDGTLQDGAFAAVAMAVTMMLAWLSWRCLEKPCIAWAKRASRA